MGKFVSNMRRDICPWAQGPGQDVIVGDVARAELNWQRGMRYEKVNIGKWYKKLRFQEYNQNPVMTYEVFSLFQ
jgi:hypothetical protein